MTSVYFLPLSGLGAAKTLRSFTELSVYWLRAGRGKAKCGEATKGPVWVAEAGTGARRPL